MKLRLQLKNNRNLESARHSLGRLLKNFAGGFQAGPWLAGLWLLLPALGTGCGSFIAHRMVQAPNSYPAWFAPAAPVLLAYDESHLTNSPAQFAEVGPPAARLRYRVIEPAEYQLNVMATNWVERGEPRYQFDFHTAMPRTNAWTAAPRGTVFLLHGYGLAEFAMVPWAFQMAEDGWRCVLVDLRGHGKSTGKQIYYGTVEARDMSRLLDGLVSRDQAALPVAVIGDSYGASLALRWKTVDPRVGRAVAIAPYGVLSNAVLNICHDYASLLPRAALRAGLKKLPSVLGVQPDDLNMTTILARHPVTALFISGTRDDVMPLADVRKLYEEALPDSKLIEVPGATHETLPYHFSELVPSVLEWLDTNGVGH